MSGGGKFRSGDTVPPQMLGQDPSLDRALSKLNQHLEPDEDALFVKADWSERSDVSLTPISQQITEELEPAAIDAIQEGERRTSSSPEQAPTGMSDLYKRRMITVQTATVPRGEATDEGLEPVPPAVEIAEPWIREEKRRGVPKKLALLIGCAAGALILLLGALLGHDVGKKDVGNEDAVKKDVEQRQAPAATPTAAEPTTPDSRATASADPAPAPSATAEAPKPSADPAVAPAAPPTTVRQAPVVKPKVAPPPTGKLEPPVPSSSAPAPKPLWLLGD